MHSYLILNEKQVYFPFASFGSPLVRLRAFSLDLNAVQIAQINALSRTTINRHLHALRQRMAICGKTAVFGLFKRNGQVHTEIVPDCRKATLQAIIRGRVGSDSVTYSDYWRGYDGLVDVGYGKHEFVRGRIHINGIEGVWGFAKSRLAKFRGMKRQTFYLHLKECEFRCNHRHDTIYHILLKSCRKYPLKLS